MNFGSRIVMLREQKGLTQYELAEKANISKSVMNRIELGTRPIRDDELISFSKILGVTVDFLLGLDSSPFKGIFMPKSHVSQEEEIFIKSYRKLNNDDKEYIKDFIELRLAKQNKEKVI